MFFSITAGFSILGRDKSDISFIASIASLTEYRGLSYGIGGDDNAFTVPNYIKHYQPNLTGYSTGKHLVEYCNGKIYTTIVIFIYLCLFFRRS